MSTTIEYDGKSYELQDPSPTFALEVSRTRAELEAMTRAQRVTLQACALFECWPQDKAWLTRPRPRSWNPATRTEKMGQEIFDSLVKAKIKLEDIAEMCAAAHTHAIMSLLSKEEIEAAERFLEAPAEDGPDSA